MFGLDLFEHTGRIQKDTDWPGTIVTLLNADSVSGCSCENSITGSARLRMRMGTQICSSSYDELIISWALRGCGENNPPQSSVSLGLRIARTDMGNLHMVSAGVYLHFDKEQKII